MYFATLPPVSSSSRSVSTASNNDHSTYMNLAIIIDQAGLCLHPRHRASKIYARCCRRTHLRTIDRNSDDAANGRSAAGVCDL